jgi:hypothetical protein
VKPARPVLLYDKPKVSLTRGCVRARRGGFGCDLEVPHFGVAGHRSSGRIARCHHGYSLVASGLSNLASVPVSLVRVTDTSSTNGLRNRSMASTRHMGNWTRQGSWRSNLPIRDSRVLSPTVKASTITTRVDCNYAHIANLQRVRKLHEAGCGQGHQPVDYLIYSRKDETHVHEL